MCEGVVGPKAAMIPIQLKIQLKKKFLQAFLIPTEGSDSSQRSLANEKLQFHCLDQSSGQGKVAETNRRLKPTHFPLSELHW